MPKRQLCPIHFLDDPSKSFVASERSTCVPNASFMNSAGESHKSNPKNVGAVFRRQQENNLILRFVTIDGRKNTKHMSITVRSRSLR